MPTRKKNKRKPKHSIARRKSWKRYYANKNKGVKCFRTYSTLYLMQRILREVVEPSYLPEKDGDYTFDELQQAFDAYMQEEWSRKVVRGLSLGLTKDERKAVASAAVDELRTHGDQWKLDEE